jgi:hypothetical protein
LALPDFLRTPERQTDRRIYLSIMPETLDGTELLVLTPLPPNADV